jgi:hypothetical protein
MRRVDGADHEWMVGGTATASVLVEGCASLDRRSTTSLGSDTWNSAGWQDVGPAMEEPSKMEVGGHSFWIPNKRANNKLGRTIMRSWTGNHGFVHTYIYIFGRDFIVGLYGIGFLGKIITGNHGFPMKLNGGSSICSKKTNPDWLVLRMCLLSARVKWKLELFSCQHRLVGSAESICPDCSLVFHVSE